MHVLKPFQLRAELKRSLSRPLKSRCLGETWLPAPQKGLSARRVRKTWWRLRLSGRLEYDSEAGEEDSDGEEDVRTNQYWRMTRMGWDTTPRERVSYATPGHAFDVWSSVGSTGTMTDELATTVSTSLLSLLLLIDPSEPRFGPACHSSVPDRLGIRSH